MLEASHERRTNVSNYVREYATRPFCTVTIEFCMRDVRGFLSNLLKHYTSSMCTGEVRGPVTRVYEAESPYDKQQQQQQLLINRGNVIGNVYIVNDTCIHIYV